MKATLLALFFLSLASCTTKKDIEVSYFNCCYQCSSSVDPATDKPLNYQSCVSGCIYMKRGLE